MLELDIIDVFIDFLCIIYF